MENQQFKSSMNLMPRYFNLKLLLNFSILAPDNNLLRGASEKTF